MCNGVDHRKHKTHEMHMFKSGEEWNGLWNGWIEIKWSFIPYLYMIVSMKQVVIYII